MLGTADASAIVTGEGGGRYGWVCERGEPVWYGRLAVTTRGGGG